MIRNKEKKLKIAGIDIGGTMIKYGLISLNGEISAGGEIGFPPSVPDIC